MIKRIAITGPESTGKSELAEALAIHYNTIWVPEFARKYISWLNRPYNYDDILKIAKGQVAKENTMATLANNYLFCDTDLIVTKIWCEYKYNKCHDWILENLKSQTYDIYLLCNMDIPWQHDPQRENPNERSELFSIYQNELESRNLYFEIVSGTGIDRLNNAIRIIDSRFNTKSE